LCLKIKPWPRPRNVRNSWPGCRTEKKTYSTCKTIAWAKAVAMTRRICSDLCISSRKTFKVLNKSHIWTACMHTYPCTYEYAFSVSTVEIFARQN
jgi:hypothetical protein